MPLPSQKTTGAAAGIHGRLTGARQQSSRCYTNSSPWVSAARSQPTSFRDPSRSKRTQRLAKPEALTLRYCCGSCSISVKTCSKVRDRNNIGRTPCPRLLKFSVWVSRRQQQQSFFFGCIWHHTLQQELHFWVVTAKWATPLSFPWERSTVKNPPCTQSNTTCTKTPPGGGKQVQFLCVDWKKGSYNPTSGRMELSLPLPVTTLDFWSWQKDSRNCTYQQNIWQHTFVLGLVCRVLPWSMQTDDLQWFVCITSTTVLLPDALQRTKNPALPQHGLFPYFLSARVTCQGSSSPCK